MKIRFIPLLLFIIPIVGCWKIDSSAKPEENLYEKDSLIVFFNLKNYSRKEISEAIDKVNELGAKVIGLNTIFDEWRTSYEDTLLVKSIYNCQKVILVADIDVRQSRFIKSHSYFVKAATGEGVTSYLKEPDGTISGYIPLMQIEEGQMLNFSYLIGYNFRPEIEEKNRLRVNLEKNIVYHKTLEDFHILDMRNLNSEKIKGKIIIFGDLDISGNPYLIYDRNHKLTKVPGVVIVANIILTTLADPE